MKNVTAYGSKAKIKNLELFIAQNSSYVPQYSVSDVKSDGTVFVRFSSTTVYPATHMVSDFLMAMSDSKKVQFEQTDETKVRLSLDMF